MSLEQQITDLTRLYNALKAQVDGLIKPEQGIWADFTPSLYQNGAVAATVNEARIFRDNKKVTLIIRLTATGSGSGTLNIYILLPTALTPASGVNLYQPLGTGSYLDNGSLQYDGTVFYVDTASGLPALALKESSVTTIGNYVGFNPSLNVASGDQFGMNLTFEIA